MRRRFAPAGTETIIILQVKGFAGAKRRRSPIFRRTTEGVRRKIKISERNYHSLHTCEGKLRTSPERSEGEDQFFGV
jgi:hypothetical protein